MRTNTCIQSAQKSIQHAIFKTNYGLWRFSFVLFSRAVVRTCFYFCVLVFPFGWLLKYFTLFLFVCRPIFHCNFTFLFSSLHFSFPFSFSVLSSFCCAGKNCKRRRNQQTMENQNIISFFHFFHSHFLIFFFVACLQRSKVISSMHNFK